ncbi:MAG TPA: lasso peptide biosynthesis B2 protein [Longimicrobiales bacterium]|nr:lasso peptide biosynthesis B2 protein [Longimicrobiales bacterium]
MSARGGVPSVVTCLLLLAAVDVSARMFGLRRTLRWAKRATRVGRVRVAADADACAGRVALASAFYPRRALCLEQSLVLFVVLRRRGVAAELRIGVQPRPFYAHAWVEVDGRPLRESRELSQSFAVFATLEV